MMGINTTATLTQPAPAFGAIKGKNKLRRWALITPLPVLFTILTIWSYTQPTLTQEHFLATWHDHTPGQGISATGALLTLSIVGTITYLIYTNIVHTANERQYHTDAQAGEQRWVRTVVRDWLNTRYKLNLSANQVENLYRGWRDRIAHTDEFGRTEWVLVHLTGLSKIREALWNDEVRDIVDVTTLDPRLEIIEEPAKPRIYEWV